jgi:hypothetical protein
MDEIDFSKGAYGAGAIGAQQPYQQSTTVTTYIPQGLGANGGPPPGFDQNEQMAPQPGAAAPFATQYGAPYGGAPLQQPYQQIPLQQPFGHHTFIHRLFSTIY